jgi:hypothetical protein
MHSKLAGNTDAILAFIALFSFLVFSGAPLQASPFRSYPGARAMAMAGAFTGIADDSSSVWFNPAGLAREKDKEGALEGTFEWSQAASIDEKDGSLRSDETAWFFGGGYSCDKFGAGLYYYTPYTIKYWAHDQEKNDTAFGKVDEVVQIIGVPLAASFFEGRLKLGVAIEWVYLNIADSGIYYRDTWGWLGTYQTAQEGTDGFAGSLGTLITLIDNTSQSYTLQLGGTYRLKSQTDIGTAASEDENSGAVSQLFFNRPESFDLSLSFTKAFPSIDSVLVLATQYGITDWGGAREEDWGFSYREISFGAEFAIEDTDAILKKKALRMGYYTSRPSGQDRIWDWPDVQGITYGIGIAVGYDKVRFCLDLTQELRSLKNDAGYNDSAMLTSLALTCTF